MSGIVVPLLMGSEAEISGDLLTQVNFFFESQAKCFERNDQSTEEPSRDPGFL